MNPKHTQTAYQIGGDQAMNRYRVLTGLATCSFLLLLAAPFAVAAAQAEQKPATTSKNVIRKAFVMTVNAGQEAEYEKRHRPIWPELEATLRKHGVVTYTIFLLPETRQLFGYVEFKDQAQWDAVAKTAICQRWWAHMKEIMPSHPDNSPISTELKEVFHIEQ
jgi:L-rhamnose mutarotase